MLFYQSYLPISRILSRVGFGVWCCLLSLPSFWLSHLNRSTSLNTGTNRYSAYSGEPMASSSPDCQAQEGLQGDFPRCRVRLHYHSDIPFRPDRLYGLLQGSRAQHAGPCTTVDQRRRRKALQVLQCRYPRGQLCASDFCPEGAQLKKAESHGSCASASISRPYICRIKKNLDNMNLLILGDK